MHEFMNTFRSQWKEAVDSRTNICHEAGTLILIALTERKAMVEETSLPFDEHIDHPSALLNHKEMGSQ